jgi:hypothetical protein
MWFKMKETIKWATGSEQNERDNQMGHRPGGKMNETIKWATGLEQNERDYQMGHRPGAN